MDLLKLLAGTAFFGGLSEASKKALAVICTHKIYRKKESVFFEGQTGSSIFLLASGGIRLYKLTPEGKEVVIRVIQPGEIFAEATLFEREAYPVSAEAMKESLVFVLPKNKFYGLLERENFRNDFLRLLMKKQRYLTERILSLTSQDVETRFFRFWIDQYGTRDAYDVSISKKDIASAIGTNPETLSRLLLRLKREKKIVWQKKIMRVNPKCWPAAAGI